MFKVGDKVYCYNYYYGEIGHSLNDISPIQKFVYGQEYKVNCIFQRGYEINGVFFDNDFGKTSTFYWKKFFRSQKELLNKKLQKVNGSR